MGRRKKKSTVEHNNQRLGIALRCVGIALLAVLFCSCLSFDIGDWPSRYFSPPNNPTENWCGSIGAFCAYNLLYYIGPGVFIMLVCGGWFLAARIAGKSIGQPVLRAVGMALLATALSSSYFLFWPDKIYNFPMGSGGVIGVATVSFLSDHFAKLGTLILVGCIWIVGLVLLADSFVVMALKYIGNCVLKVASMAAPTWAAAREHSQRVGKIWQRLSVRQKFEQARQNLLSREHTTQGPMEPVSSASIAEAEKEIIPAGGTDRKEIKVTPSKPRRERKAFVQASYDDYTLPPLDLLSEPEQNFPELQNKVVKSKAATLESLLDEFNIEAHVVAAETGPVVTMFELELAAGVKVSQISSLANDIARALGVGAVRVVAPLPGKHTIGVEVPNSEKEKVRIKDIMRIAGEKPARMNLPLFLGKDSSGEALVSDLTSMPHLLIAGTTGSGKSVCINTIITGILLTKRPDEVKLILIDPKMVEMTAFSTIPHLMCPIVTETNRAVKILEWATVKMDERYAVLAEARVKNISEFNRLSYEEIMERFSPTSEEEEAKVPKRLPYIVIVIDELADLMMTAPKEIEAYIVRLAQKSRAVGIHIVLATQRPQATVVTGLIKSNMPTRIGFRVAARMDSRIILDQNGAEALLGQGDMLFLKPGTSDLIRAQGTFVDDGEVRSIVKHLKEIAEPQFHPELTQINQLDADMLEQDELFDDAVRIVLETKRGSVSLLQRRLSIGYARASRIIEMMAVMGVLGEYKGSQAREVIVTLEEYEQMKAEAGASGSAERDDDEPQYIREGQRAHAALDEDDQ